MYKINCKWWSHIPAQFFYEWGMGIGKMAYSPHFLKMFEKQTVRMPTRMWSNIRRYRLNTWRCRKRRRHKQEREEGVNPTTLISVELLWTQIYETKSHNITVMTINVHSLKPKHLDTTQYLLILMWICTLLWRHGYRTLLLMKHGWKPLT